MKSTIIERNMFYGASRNIFERAASLRKSMTREEKILWKELRNRNIFRTKFRRQHPIDIFIVDFYCHEYKLAIEIDGEIHFNKEVIEYDYGRTHDLEKLGITILRFSNDQIYSDLEGVKNEIRFFIDTYNKDPIQASPPNT